MAAPRPSDAPGDAHGPGVGSVGGSGGPEPAADDTALRNQIIERAAEWARMYPISSNALGRTDDGAWKLARVWGEQIARIAVMPVVQAALAEQTQRAEQAERERNDYRDRFTNQMTAATELIEKLRQAEARLAELEGALNWQTSCTSCARVLDSAYAETMRAERAEAAVQRVRDLAEQAKRDAEESFSVQFGGAPGPARLPVDDVLAALDGGGAPEIGDRYLDRHGEEWFVGTNGLMHHHSYSQRDLDELRREYGPLTRIGVPR